MTNSQLAVVHDNEQLLLQASTWFTGHQFNVFACHDIDAAHAAIDHEIISALVLSPATDQPTDQINQRVIGHLKAYHPDITILFIDLASRAAVLACANFLTSQPNQTEPLGTSGQLFHMKHLQHFINHPQITTVFQPIVSLNEAGPRQAFGLEALSRIPWPNGTGTINPEILFSYAANLDRLFELDLSCMAAAFSQAHRQRLSTRIFINVRPLTLIHPHFFARIQELSRHLPASMLVFELTEHDTLPDLQVLIQAAQRLKDLGFELAIDDFGKGYANLNLLCALSPGFIKISGLFAANLTLSSRKQAIVKAVSSLASDLAIAVILENIDSENCAQEALRLGILLGQGYHFGRPLDRGGREPLPVNSNLISLRQS